jgi:hypothetical protein
MYTYCITFVLSTCHSTEKGYHISNEVFCAKTLKGQSPVKRPQSSLLDRPLGSDVGISQTVPADENRKKGLASSVGIIN